MVAWVVSIEVSPIQRHHDGGSCADDVGHPANQNVVDLDGWIGQQPVHLFDRMLELQTAGDGEALANRTDRQGGAVQYAQSGIAE